jgi:hypothetical protein
MAAGLLAAGCGSASPTAPTSPDPTTYLNAMVDVMQAHSINRLSIDWTTFRSSVLGAATGAKSLRDALPAISLALSLLGDHHSYYVSNTGYGQLNNPSLPKCAAPGFPANPSVPSNIGYVYVAPCPTCDFTTFAAQLQSAIRSADGPGIVGWIVDLRSNTGGAFQPMVAGVGPILGEGLAGYFIGPDGQTVSWAYANGQMIENGFTQVTVPGPYTLLHQNPAVAVLLDNLTSSSGEATLVSFLGRPRTRTFGATTCGLATANERFTLSDGAYLQLTTSVDADRTMHAYGGPIQPDEPVDDSTQVVQAAITWLRAPPSLPNF